MARTKQDVLNNAAARGEARNAAARARAAGAERAREPEKAEVDAEVDATAESDHSEEVEEAEGEAEEPMYEIGEVLAERTHMGQKQFLVTWVGYDDQTWEPHDSLAHTEAMEVWERERKANPLEEEEEEEEDEESEEGVRGRKRRRQAADPDYEEDGDDDEDDGGSWKSDESDSSDSSEGYVPGRRAGGAKGGRKAKGSARRAPPLREGQAARLQARLDECDAEVLRQVVYGLVKAHPDLLREAHTLLT